jgi:hypothetical protein
VGRERDDRIGREPDDVADDLADHELQRLGAVTEDLGLLALLLGQREIGHLRA